MEPVIIQCLSLVEITAFRLNSKSCKGFFFDINFPQMRDIEFLTGHVTFKLRYNKSSNWNPPMKSFCDVYIIFCKSKQAFILSFNLFLCKTMYLISENKIKLGVYILEMSIDDVRRFLTIFHPHPLLKSEIINGCSLSELVKYWIWWILNLQYLCEAVFHYDQYMVAFQKEFHTEQYQRSRHR